MSDSRTTLCLVAVGAGVTINIEQEVDGCDEGLPCDSFGWSCDASCDPVDLSCDPVGLSCDSEWEGPCIVTVRGGTETSFEILSSRGKGETITVAGECGDECDWGGGGEGVCSGKRE